MTMMLDAATPVVRQPPARVNRGFESKVTPELEGAIYACVLEGGRCLFGRLALINRNEICPEGTWVDDSWFARSFSNRGDDARRLLLRTRGYEGTPTPVNALQIEWFRPVLDTGATEEIWDDFLDRSGVVLSERLQTATLNQPFGGLGSKVKITVTEERKGRKPVPYETTLTVAGMVVTDRVLAYQIVPGTSLLGLPDNHQPAAILRGWSEVERASSGARVVFHERRHASRDLAFSLA
jgi:hypothetical protein